MLHSNLGINEQGNLTFSGRDTVELAAKYGTPVYLVDNDRLRSNMRTYVSGMRECFGEDSEALFASKAMAYKGVYRIAAEEGMCVDVVSSGELYTAVSSGFPASRIYFHGNNKTDADICYAMGVHIGCFIVDNYEELMAVDAEAGKRGIVQNILLRLTPGIEPHTFEAVNTGKLDCQFGTPIETGQAREIVLDALKLKNVNLLGYHCHIGSQIFESSPFCSAVDIMMKFDKEILDETGFEAKVMNLGGGFGVRYVESDPVLNVKDCLKELSEHLHNKCTEYGLKQPRILMEPGRSIVADAGLTLYTIGSVKTIRGYRSYVSVDGGMSDNPRYALYKSPYTIAVANKMNEPTEFLCSVAGRCCETGALIQEDVLLADCKRGDILAVFVTGAYNFSMASNYNRVGRPPVVAIENGRDFVTVRRETWEDMAERDL